MSQIKITAEKAWLRGRLQIRKKEDGTGDGEAVGYHENGRLQFCYPMVDGEFEGKGRCWSSNEQLVCEESYRFGKLDGMRQEWCEDGCLKSLYFYEKGSPRYGKTWHPNGQLHSEEFYKEGRLNGVRRCWYSNGNLKIQQQYDLGLPTSGQEWHENGRLAFEHSMLNGLLHGVQKSWYETGAIRNELHYSHGRREGSQKAWYPDGIMQFDYFFRDGRRHGLQRLWTAHGYPRSEQFFIRDVHIPLMYRKLLESGKIHSKHIIGIKNAAVRRVCLEEYGYARFLSEINHEIVDRDGEQELVKVTWHPREEVLCLVKVKCPSTGAFYTLRVPPHMKTVKAAVAWTFDVKADNYDPLKET